MNEYNRNLLDAVKREMGMNPSDIAKVRREVEEIRVQAHKLAVKKASRKKLLATV